MENTDDRIGTNALSVARRPRTASGPSVNADVGDRAMDDREVTQNREISEDERVELFRMQNFQSVLPNLPDIPGWHVCWLSTTHPSDTIQSRMRLGYEPVKPTDVPGLELHTVTTGEHAGRVMVKEMIAFKLPMSLYQKYMTIAHHDEPLRLQEGIVAQIDMLKQQAVEMEGRLDEGDGMSELRRAAPRARAFS